MNESYDYKGYKIRIERDDNPMNPRTEWDNRGTMVCFHRRYNLGDKHEYSESQFESWKEFREHLEKEEDVAVILPLFLRDHSGITMSCSSSRFAMCDSAGWDWGQVGFIFISKAKVRHEWSKKRISQKLLETVTNALIAEVDTYDKFLTGDVWGFIIGNDEDDHIDSCWGFFGYDYCKEEAESVVDYLVKQAEEATAERVRVYAAMPCCQA